MALSYKNTLIGQPTGPQIKPTRKIKSTDTQVSYCTLRPDSQQTCPPPFVPLEPIEPTRSVELVTYIYPEATFATTGPEMQLFTIDSIRSYSKKVTNVTVRDNNNDNCINYAEIRIDETKMQLVINSISMQILPLSSPCSILAKIADKTTDEEFSIIANYKTCNSYSCIDVNNFGSIMKKNLSIFGFYLTNDRKQYLANIADLKDCSFYSYYYSPYRTDITRYHKCESRSDDQYHCYDRDNLMRIAVDAIIQTDYILLDNKTIALCYMPNNYPHVVIIRPDGVSIYDGAQYRSSKKNLLCSGHCTHPLTMLLVCEALVKKNCFDDKLTSTIIQHLLPKLNTDLMNHNLIQKPQPSIRLLCQSVSFDKFVDEDKCMLHMVYMKLLAAEKFKTLLSFEHRNINYVVHIDDNDFTVREEVDGTTTLIGCYTCWAKSSVRRFVNHIY